MFNAVGGSTIHWSGHFPRFRPSDFRVRTLDGVADDWPLTYWDLGPLLRPERRLHRRLRPARRSGVSPAPAPSWPAAGPGAGRGGLRAGPGAPRLALVAFGQRPPLRRPHRTPGGTPSATPAAPATWAAPPGPCPAPTSPTGRRRSPRGASCAPGPGCGRSPWIGHGRAAGAVYYDAAGRVQEQPARLVVLAGNGIGTPRLLLNSVSGRFPGGLANSSGQVGRNLMFHPFALRQRDLRRAPGRLPGPPGHLPALPGVLRDRPAAGASCAASSSSSAGTGPPDDRPGRLHPAPAPLGAGAPPGPPRSASPTPSTSA